MKKNSIKEVGNHYSDNNHQSLYFKSIEADIKAAESKNFNKI